MTWSAADDRRIRAWLDEGAPDRAPATVLESTFARTSAVNPASVRRGRRASFALVLAAALAVAAVVAGATIVALSPRPAPLPASAVPRFLGDYLWAGGFRFEPATPTQADMSAQAAAAVAGGLAWREELGEPDPPIFGHLVCEAPGLCGPDLLPDQLADAGTVDTWSAWVVEYPQEAAFVIVRARDGQIHAMDDGDRLGSCSPDDVGRVPWCPAGGPDALELPADARYALSAWGQVFVHEWEFTTRPDREQHVPPDHIDPRRIAAALAADPSVVDAFAGDIACQRTACPTGVVDAPGATRAVWIVSVDDGARWAIADATTGEILADDSSPVEP